MRLRVLTVLAAVVAMLAVAAPAEAIKNGVRPGTIDATAQQYPQNMAREVDVHAYAGSDDVVEFSRLTEERVRLRVRSGGREGPIAYERVIDGRDTRRVRIFLDRREDEVIGEHDLPFDVEIVDERPE